MILTSKIAFTAVWCLCIATFASGQRYGNRAGVPDWQVDEEFKQDVFTFARVQYSSSHGEYTRGGWGRRGRSNWATDYSDAELNFAYRLQQMTSLKVNPDSIVVELTQPDLYNYPFLYIIEPRRLVFIEDEVVALHNYLLNGGFLMVDDFWGDVEYDNFYYEIKRVFPEREPVELPIEHPIFHMVFDLKEKPQVPSIHHATCKRGSGITWERQGEDKWCFREFAEKKAYPMGINIIFYAMTH